jgi:hypothetical protein
MPSLENHQSGQFTKLLLIGDSGTGKTGGLASLVKAGYKLRILDYDNGLDSLKQQLQHIDRSLLANVEFRTLRDKTKSTPAGPAIDGVPKAFPTGLAMLDNWKYDDVDLGKPSSWGPEAILVIDSLTFMSKAAMNWVKVMQSSVKDGRMLYYHAQQAIESVLGMLQAAEFATNVIVISHINWIERQDGTTKGYPTAIGSALSPQIPQYFNSVALVTSSGSGDKVRRTVQTAPTAMIDLKNPAPFAMAASLPLETAMADFFKTVRS